MSKSDTKTERYRVTQKVTLTGAVVNIILATAQVIGGLLTQSQALIADGFHTLSDLITDFVVLVAAKMASKAPDDDHPYGHERIETIATVILGLALAGVAVGIVLDAVQRLMHPESLLQPGVFAIFIALFGILCKEGLYHYTRKAGEKVNSSLLKANALHHRSDAISSVIVAVGVTASVIFSIPWLDALAAIAVAVLIFYMGAKLILDSAMELVDTAWDSNKVDAMLLTIGTISGVHSVHMLRTRKMSNNVLLDVHIQVSPHVSVSEGHHIAEQVMTRIHQDHDEVSDIVVHIDPEDDETAAPSKDLPDRDNILAQIEPTLVAAQLTYSTTNITLHYLDGKVEIELCLDEKPSSDQLTTITNVCNSITNVRNVRISQRLI